MSTRRKAAFTVAAAVVTVLGVLCVVFVPSWLVGTASGLGPVDRLKAVNDVRATLLQALGGVLALAGVGLGALLTSRQLLLNREIRSIDLFTKAIDQLGAERQPTRHGAVYALEQLAELDPRYRGPVHGLLTSFICFRAPWQPGTERREGGLADDVAAALAALGRGGMIEPGTSSELERVDLRGADLTGYAFPRACFAGANLAGAVLRNTNLADATLTGTLLRDADLRGTDLTGADLADADLTGARADGTTRWPEGFTPPA